VSPFYCKVVSESNWVLKYRLRKQSHCKWCGPHAADALPLSFARISSAQQGPKPALHRSCCTAPNTSAVCPLDSTYS
jgi:hypothetical protein